LSQSGGEGKALGTTDTRRRSCDHRSKLLENTFTSKEHQRWPAANHQQLGERCGTDCLSAFTTGQPGWHLDLRLLASKTRNNKCPFYKALSPLYSVTVDLETNTSSSVSQAQRAFWK
jgi:hypothetical protein